MKKILSVLLVSFLFTGPVFAQTSLSQALPLLRLTVRTPAQTQQVLQLFRTSQDSDVIFAAGASLVKIPPTKTVEPALLNLVMTAQNPLKKAFSAVILTAMGSAYEELSPLLIDLVHSQDPVLRAYGAAAYALVNPADSAYTADVVRLYIFDPAFAQRALNMLTQTPQEQLALLKKSSSADDPQIRAAAAAWLGALHTPAATQILLKRARKEKDPSVQTQLAMALAQNPDQSLETVLQGLSVAPEKPVANTYALTLGFMTGNSVNTLKSALLSGSSNQRINALRATAYMAGVLANPDAFSYSSDRVFDTHLLKGLVPPISALAQNGSVTEKTYAQNALTQIEKLL